MKAHYFRYLFQNTIRGTVHTVGTNGEQGTFCLCYLCSDGETGCVGTMLTDRLSRGRDRISVLVLEKLHEEDLDVIKTLLKTNQVEKVILPYGDKAVEVKELELAGKVLVLNAGQKAYFQEKGWEVWVKCLDNGPQGTLVLYHGPSEEMEAKQDCQMAVKPFDESLPCTVQIDPENHACAMKCCLYNDFTLCKGHNRKDSEGYVTGTLLLGNADLQEHGQELRKDLQDKLSKVRLTVLPGSGDHGTKEFLDCLDTVNRELNRYFVLSKSGKDNEKLLKEVAQRGLRHIPVYIGEGSGLCVSGLFAEKE